LTRKHVADMFLCAELEIEARNAATTRLTTWQFKADDDWEKYIEEVIEHAEFTLYSHHQFKNCSKIGICICISDLYHKVLTMLSCVNMFLTPVKLALWPEFFLYS